MLRIESSRLDVTPEVRCTRGVGRLVSAGWMPPDGIVPAGMGPAKRQELRCGYLAAPCLRAVGASIDPKIDGGQEQHLMGASRTETKLAVSEIALEIARLDHRGSIHPRSRRYANRETADERSAIELLGQVTLERTMDNEEGLCRPAAAQAAHGPLTRGCSRSAARQERIFRQLYYLAEHASSLFKPDEPGVPPIVLSLARLLSERGVWYRLSRNLPAESCRDAAQKRDRLGHVEIELWEELKSFLRWPDRVRRETTRLPR